MAELTLHIELWHLFTFLVVFFCSVDLVNFFASSIFVGALVYDIKYTSFLSTFLTFLLNSRLDDLKYIKAKHKKALFELHRFMDLQAADCLKLMRDNDVSIDDKASYMTHLKSSIKHRQVPDNATSSIFEIVRIAIGSPQSSLSFPGFAILNNVVKRLNLQDDAHLIVHQGQKTFAILLERLGDHKEKIRLLAAQAFTDFWPACPAEVEHLVVDVSLTGKNARAKETSLAWLANMTTNHGLLFRNHVGKVIDCLEDQDGGVRDTAKTTVVGLFQTAPDRARSDLKKQLQQHNVRKSIVASILSQLGLDTQYENNGDALKKDAVISTRSSVNGDAPMKDAAISTLSCPPIEASKKDATFSTLSHPPIEAPKKDATFSTHSHLTGNAPKNDAAVPTLSQHTADVPKKSTGFQTLPMAKPILQKKDTGISNHAHSKSDTAKDSSQITSYFPKGDPPRNDAVLDNTVANGVVPPTPADLEADKIEPIYINSHKEFDEIIRDMQPYFEGKESEQNWLNREKSVLKLRRLNKGNAPSDYPQYYNAGIKTLLDGILKTVNSLRTTLSSTGCALLQEIAKKIGSGVDPLVEILLQNLIKLCGGTKKISSQNGNLTVDAVMGNASYNSRLLHHVWGACQDKNVQPRLYVTGWLKTLINKHGRYCEHGGGLELIEKSIKKGLSDANPGVREGMRGTYWTFARVWPEKAEIIMSTLDPKSKGLLEKDPANPNVVTAHLNSSFGGQAVLSKSTTSIPTRVSLKEAIAAQKKAQKAAKDIPSRPESAHSTFSDTQPTLTTVHRPNISTASTARSTLNSSTTSSVSAGSLSSAPMRPPMRPARRPELARPATADPYAMRKLPSTGTQSKIPSPTESPTKPKAKPAVPSSKPANSTKAMNQKVELPPASTTKAKPKKLDISNTKSHELRPMTTPALKPASSKFIDATTALPSPTKANEDFTMVMPNFKTINDIEPPSLKKVGVLFTNIETSSRKKDGILFRNIEAPLLSKDAALSLDIEHTSPKEIESLFQNIEPTSPKKGIALFKDIEISSLRKDGSLSNDRSARTSIPRPVKRHSPSSSDDLSNAETLKVYEDPDPINTKPAQSQAIAKASEYEASRPVTKVNPLGELPINEPAATQFRFILPPEFDFESQNAAAARISENTLRRWQKIEVAEKRRSISPRSKDPEQARDMIEKGIHRIRSKTLDLNGFRKLQGLIKFHDTIFKDEEKYDEMLLALLESLETPNDEKRTALGRPLDVKTQVLVTVRLMFVHNPKYFAAYYPRAMVALITARKHYDGTAYIVSGLEQTAEDIAGACKPRDVILSILEVLETEEEKSEGGLRTITMGLYTLSGLLNRLNKETNKLDMRLEDATIQRLGSLAQWSLRQSNSDIRRACIDYCLELLKMVKSEEGIFWSMVNTPAQDFKSLITYFIESKERERKERLLRA